MCCVRKKLFLHIITVVVYYFRYLLPSSCPLSGCGLLNGRLPWADADLNTTQRQKKKGAVGGVAVGGAEHGLHWANWSNGFHLSAQLHWNFTGQCEVVCVCLSPVSSTTYSFTKTVFMWPPFRKYPFALRLALCWYFLLLQYMYYDI